MSKTPEVEWTVTFGLCSAIAGLVAYITNQGVSMDAKELGNQPAYPVPAGCGTKREVDELAEMQGSLSHPQQDVEPEIVLRHGLAMWAVKWVDAMLAELAKPDDA